MSSDERVKIGGPTAVCLGDHFTNGPSKLARSETDSPYSRYLPIPTSHSRTIKLNGRPNNHIITYAIRYLLY